MRSSRAAAPDYGLDAPGVVKILFLIGVLCFVGFTVVGIAFSPRFGDTFAAWLDAIGFVYLVVFTGTACGMIWSSKIGKLRTRDRLLDLVDWKGDEKVLDVGCGRGLMLVGAAKRLTRGKAVGIDIWQAVDLTGNRPESTLENAHSEGAADRVEIQTADMRKLPFSDGQFDAIFSMNAVHNLVDPGDREKAIAEIARTLKPGGLAIIADIRHAAAYADTFSKHGCGEVRRLGSPWKRILVTAITWGAVRPDTVLAHKSLSPAPSRFHRGPGRG